MFWTYLKKMYFSPVLRNQEKTGQKGLFLTFDEKILKCFQSLEKEQEEILANTNIEEFLSSEEVYVEIQQR